MSIRCGRIFTLSCQNTDGSITLVTSAFLCLGGGRLLLRCPGGGGQQQATGRIVLLVTFLPLCLSTAADNVIALKQDFQYLDQVA